MKISVQNVKTKFLRIKSKPHLNPHPTPLTPTPRKFNHPAPPPSIFIDTTIIIIIIITIIRSQKHN